MFLDLVKRPVVDSDCIDERRVQTKLPMLVLSSRWRQLRRKPLRADRLGKSRKSTVQKVMRPGGVKRKALSNQKLERDFVQPQERITQKTLFAVENADCGSSVYTTKLGSGVLQAETEHRQLCPCKSQKAPRHGDTIL